MTLHAQQNRNKEELFMRRGILLGCLYSLGGITVFIMSALMGIDVHSWRAFFLCFAFGIGMLVFLGKAVDQIGRVNMDSWLASVADCKYKYAWDGSGIAIDIKNSKIYLTSRFNRQSTAKMYSLYDVREWGYEIPGFSTQKSGMVIGGGLGNASHNIGASIGDGITNMANISNARENTGLWLKVKDIDFPKWFIKFKTDNKTENELTRWMEILQQSINEK